MKTVGIIGGGPAGLSCALWLKNHGFHPVVIENRSRLGGLLGDNFHKNDWLIGHFADTGHTICEKFVRHVDLKEIKAITGAVLESAFQTSAGFELVVKETSMAQIHLFSDYLVVASGTSPRATPELYTLQTLCPDRVIIGAGDMRIHDSLAGSDIAILGGGDNAFENALWLAELGNRVHIHVRHTPRARLDFIESCKKHPLVHVHLHSGCTNFRIQDDGIVFNANSTQYTTEFLLVMFGYSPNTAFIEKVAPWMAEILDEHGFIPVDLRQRTPIPNLYAVGDVTNLQFPCIPTAIAQGSVAAKSIVLTAQGLTPENP